MNIALIRDGQPVLGVVHAPAHGVTYFAAAGEGSWRRRGDGPATRIVATPPTPGAALRVAESRSHGSPDLDDMLAGYRIRERIAVGSSIKFCLVADGTADCYVRLGPTMEWDVAAGDCVFRWAAIGAPHPSPLTYNKADLRNAAFVVGFLPPPPAVVWLTGLSGAGKSTIAAIVVRELERAGARVEWLDGDAIRDVFPATGFTRPERDAHVKRVGYLASRLEAHGVTVVASLVSPYRESRAFVRSLCREFVEVHVATDLAECERRDSKGLYARARAGADREFHGARRSLRRARGGRTGRPHGRGVGARRRRANRGLPSRVRAGIAREPAADESLGPARGSQCPYPAGGLRQFQTACACCGRSARTARCSCGWRARRSSGTCRSRWCTSTRRTRFRR